MGGLVVQAAVGLGVIDPESIDRIVYLACPFEGAPAAFGAIYDDGRLPILRELVWLFNRRRNSRAFFTMMMECVRTFPSVYQLMPPLPHRFLFERPGEYFNPFEGTYGLCIPQEFHDDVLEAQEALAAGRQLLDQRDVLRHHVYGDHHSRRLTPSTFRVRPHEAAQAFDVLETTHSAYGDGTVGRESARGNTPHPIASVDHARAANDRRVAAILRALIGAAT
jgi:hypothetical protein